MQRRLILALAVILFLSSHPARAQTAAPAIVAPEAIVIDGWTGNVLYQKNPDVERAPASTVKIMTFLVILRQHVSMKRVVTVSAHAATIGGSTAGLWTGEQISVWNLLHGMMMPSGNDAAIALSEAVGGTERHFVQLMNEQAARLHLWHTHYLSPNGFDMWGQVSTARDLAWLARTAMMYPRFERVVRTKFWTVRNPAGVILHRWQNLNQLLWDSRDVDGVKTGTTPYAGACLVSSARKDGRWVIAVNMGSTEETRFSDAESLLNYGLSQDPAPPSTR